MYVRRECVFVCLWVCVCGCNAVRHAHTVHSASIGATNPWCRANDSHISGVMASLVSMSSMELTSRNNAVIWRWVKVFDGTTRFSSLQNAGYVSRSYPESPPQKSKNNLRKPP